MHALSTVSTVSTVIVQYYLHLRWYFYVARGIQQGRPIPGNESLWFRFSNYGNVFYSLLNENLISKLMQWKYSFPFPNFVEKIRDQRDLVEACSCSRILGTFLFHFHPVSQLMQWKYPFPFQHLLKKSEVSGIWSGPVHNASLVRTSSGGGVVLSRQGPAWLWFGDLTMYCSTNCWNIKI